MGKTLDKLLEEKRGTIKARRIKKILTNTRTLEKLAGRPIEDILKSMEKVHELAEKIDSYKYAPNKKSDLRQYAPNTKSDLRLMLKMLWKVANGYHQADRPSEVHWIKIGVARKDMKHPKLINEDELKKMLKVAGVRDRAAISLLYECGLRPSEILSLKKSDLEFIDKGVRVHIPEGTKTGARDILAGGNAEPALANWLNAHPIKKQDALLFPSEYGTGNFKLMTTDGLNKMIRTTAAKAGIARRIKTYDFRHTAATINARFFSEAQLRKYMGWTQDSTMAAVYVDMSGRDTDDGVARKHNKPVEPIKNEAKTEPKVCKRCNKTNMHDAEMCAYCGLSFDKEKAKRDMLSMQDELAAIKKENETTKRDVERLMLMLGKTKIANKMREKLKV